jgi:hypothetical protein
MGEKKSTDLFVENFVVGITFFGEIDVFYLFALQGTTVKFKGL